MAQSVQAKSLESTCIHCGAATKQWRMQVTSPGNLTIRCGHCRKHYTVPGNPDPALRPVWRPLRRPPSEPAE